MPIKPRSFNEGCICFSSCCVSKQGPWLPAFLAEWVSLQNSPHSFIRALVRTEGLWPWRGECKVGVSRVPPVGHPSTRFCSESCGATPTATASLSACHAQVSVCLWCAMAVYDEEERESLPARFTNASLTHDISSQLERSS